MKRPILFVLVVLLVSSGSAQRALRSGTVIRSSVKFKKAVYTLPAPADTAKALVLIQGHNIVVDFGQLELDGGGGKNPDEFTGIAVLVRNSTKVTIRNLRARGYKVALLARNVQQLVIENCDFSYNYRQHLGSTQEKEDMADWMSYHHNERDEWLRYGAAIYLRDCHQARVSQCRVTGGQNALMMTDCNNGRIYNNEFTFNSGIGIGMYRCSGNTIAFNRIDFNVRGYSHGVYSRGQDSAGILVYEQSNQNVFYRNSVTHGGDGFFLWAGQTTMDSGKGGSNDNLLLGNDFSYAPTNGVEVTFSRNRISHNRIFECDHGIWGGYSFGTRISDNQFRDNRIAIAIEHGQANEILFNLFSRDREAIRLWANARQPADWGYARYRDTRSAGYTIAGNSFNGNQTVVSLNRTDSVNLFTNTYAGYEVRLKTDSTVGWIDSTEMDLPDTTFVVPDIPAPMDPFKGGGRLAGRQQIRMTEWGPYDYRYPLLWRSNPVDSSGVYQFELLGPAGKWKLVSARGIRLLTDSSGTVPGVLRAERAEGPVEDVVIELEFTGGMLTDPFGRVVPAGKPYRFGYRHYFHPVAWRVNWFPLDTLVNHPVRSNQLFPPNGRIRRLKGETVDRLDYAWWGGVRDEAGTVYPQFITTAEGQADFSRGMYEIGVTWDDALRVYVDGRLVVDEWDPSRYSFDESPHRQVKLELSEGRHFFKVEHLELGGFACLGLKIRLIE